MPATIQCRIVVFEITVSGYTELLLWLLSHKGTYTLSTTSTFISVYCMLLVLDFVEREFVKNYHKAIVKYIMIFSIQRCRVIISFPQQPKHAASNY